MDWIIDDIPSFLTEIKVDAGNLEEVIIKNSNFCWFPNIDKQIERLTQEWFNPNSDGTGVLTYDKFMVEMTIKFQEEIIDNKIFKNLAIKSKYLGPLNKTT